MKSIVWGYKDFPISQEFGVPGFRPDWYQYSASLGWPPGYHVGLDVAMPRGTPIFAKESGVVVEAGANEYFRPKPVYIQEDDGDIAIYGHLWDNTVKRGDHVAAGQKIGISGEQTIPGTMTPDGSGPHIHFELRRPVLDDKGRPTGSYKAIDPKDELLGATGATFLSSRTGQGQLMGFSLDPDSTTGKIVMGIILVSVTLGALIYAASA